MASDGGSNQPTSTDFQSLYNNTLKTILWSHVSHVEMVDKGDASGGNVKWKCMYCNHVATISYTRAKAHLLKISSQGICLS